MAGPVVLTLGSWAEKHLREVLEAKTRRAFDDAFDGFVPPHVAIAVNGAHTSRAEFKRLLWRDEEAESSARVAFKGVVEVPKRRDEIIQVGEVGLFFEAKLHRGALLFDNDITASMNLVVKAIKPRRDDDGKDFDGRQATEINMVFTDVPSNVEREY
ncbi:hypothetical protein PsYK624_091810 [Phanerochaete sordida]|uniref:Uncharacterized protein n=1 Tax=Phanerochaete sordida TaxID=48140 RepID=A0A9P3GC38_9APHY|nr:hypothetical protein PsYK624_091810 [Phanerochaete sordida]